MVDHKQNAGEGRNVRDCWTCGHDLECDDGQRDCGNPSLPVDLWIIRSCFTGDMPTNATTDCPGWAPKEPEPYTPPNLSPLTLRDLYALRNEITAEINKRAEYCDAG